MNVRYWCCEQVVKVIVIVVYCFEGVIVLVWSLFYFYFVVFEFF